MNLWKYNDKKYKTIEPDSETERVRCGADVWTGLSVRRCDGTGPDSIPWPVLQGRRSSQKGGSRVVGSWAHRLRSHTGTQLSLKLVSITGDTMNITGVTQVKMNRVSASSSHYQSLTPLKLISKNNLDRCAIGNVFKTDELCWMYSWYYNFYRSQICWSVMKT